MARTVQKYQKTVYRLVNWMEQNIPEGLMVFAFQTAHRRLLRTTNVMERLHREV